MLTFDAISLIVWAQVSYFEVLSVSVKGANLTNRSPFYFFQLLKLHISLHFCRLLVGDYYQKKVDLNFNACGNWEIINVELNSLTGSMRLQRLQAIFQISIWNNRIKSEQNYGQLQLVSHKLVPFLCTTFNSIVDFCFYCIWLVLNFHLATWQLKGFKFLQEDWVWMISL